MDFTKLQSHEHAEWNAFVAEHSLGEIAHLAEWSEFYEETYNYRSFYTIIRDETGITGILPVINQKGLFKNILITSSAGILTKKNMVSDNQIVSYLGNLSIKTGAKDVICIKTELGENVFFKSDEHVRLIRRLPGDPEMLWNEIGAKQRNAVRKSEKFNLKHRIIVPDKKDIEVFYKIYAENYRDLGTPVNSLKYFTNQLKYFSEYLKLLLVEYHGKIIGGMWLHHYKNLMSDPEAASLRKFFHTGVNDYMYYSAFKYATKNGYKAFNMGRSIKNSGTYFFKSKWGNIVVEALPVIRFNSQKSIGGNKQKYKLAIRLWKKLPVSCAGILGPCVRKHTYFE